MYSYKKIVVHYFHSPPTMEANKGTTGVRKKPRAEAYQGYENYILQSEKESRKNKSQNGPITITDS